MHDLHMPVAATDANLSHGTKKVIIAFEETNQHV